jgi:hypothetical protein
MNFRTGSALGRLALLSTNGSGSAISSSLESKSASSAMRQQTERPVRKFAGAITCGTGTEADNEIEAEAEGSHN